MSSRLTTSDRFDLHVEDFQPKGAPRVSVAILHGYGEHGGRYRHVAEALKARGIAVVVADLRGHGRSSGVRGHIFRFEDYHNDVSAVVDRARLLGAGAPVAIFAHSMGALLVCDWMLRGHGRGLAGVALSSPFLGLALAVNPVKSTLGRVMSRLIPTLALPSGLKGSDACQDPELQKLYDSDPLNNKSATARWFTEAMAAIERVHARAGELGSKPMIVLYGGADKIASPEATDRFVQKLAGSPNVTVERLDGHYHEIVNELPEVRAKVIERFVTWLDGLARADARDLSSAAQ